MLVDLLFLSSSRVHVLLQAGRSFPLAQQIELQDGFLVATVHVQNELGL